LLSNFKSEAIGVNELRTNELFKEKQQEKAERVQYNASFNDMP